MTTDDGVMAGDGPSSSVKCGAEEDYLCIRRRASALSKTWLDLGGRHIDGANHYKTQASVADALAESKVPRSDVFLTTKCPGTLGYDATIQCVDDNLQMLGLFGAEGVGHLDLLMIHYAGRMTPACRFKRGEASGCDPPFATLDNLTKADLQATWRAMEELKRLGVVKALGVSIFTVEQMEMILENATEPIDVLQTAYSPWMHHPSVLDFCRARNITLQSRAAVHTYRQPASPAITAAAAAHNVTATQVALRWILQQGLPFVSDPVSEQDMAEDMGAFDFELTEEEMQSIAPARPILV